MAAVVLIDDEPGMRQLVRRILERAGHTVHSCEDGASAIAQIERDPPDLVITDILMPDMDGLEIVMKVRERVPALPVLVISGASERGLDYLRFSKMLGAHATLGKPFRPAELIAAVDQLLAGPG